MFRKTGRRLAALDDRGPLRVMFLLTSMPVGGAETLLVDLVRRLDRSRFLPELCCLKTLGPLGEQLAAEVPATSGLLAGKYDLGVLPRLTGVLRQRRIDALVIVGAGDKMFWGRLAARRAGVPVVISALHSTGWPDGIGRLNRALTPLTDAFVAVAGAHGRHLVEIERFPAEKVRVIPNGVDVDRFAQPHDRAGIRKSLGVPADAPVAGIVAALRPEKDHGLFLEVAARVRERVADARFLIVGDGPERAALEAIAAQRNLTGAVHFLGTCSDIPQLLAALDVFVLTSRMEANPVSILEAMSAGKPVVAPQVGSIAESVEDGTTGFLTAQGDAVAAAQRVAALLADRPLAETMGRTGQERVRARWSLEAMVQGYQTLIAEIYRRKSARPVAGHTGQPPALPGVLQPGRGNP